MHLGVHKFVDGEGLGRHCVFGLFQALVKNSVLQVAWLREPAPEPEESRSDGFGEVKGRS